VAVGRFCPRGPPATEALGCDWAPGPGPVVSSARRQRPDRWGPRWLLRAPSPRVHQVPTEYHQRHRCCVRRHHLPRPVLPYDPSSSAGPTPSVMATVGARLRVVAADRSRAAVLGRSRGRWALCCAALGGHARHRAALERPACRPQDLSSPVGGGCLTAEAGAASRATVAERVGASRFAAAGCTTCHLLTRSCAAEPRDPRFSA
jgi:hypothetical protein